MKDVEEGRIEYIGQKDILTLVLDTLEYPGRVRGNGGKKKPKQFNTPKPSKAPEENKCEKDVKGECKDVRRGDSCFEN